MHITVFSSLVMKQSSMKERVSSHAGPGRCCINRHKAEKIQTIAQQVRAQLRPHLGPASPQFLSATKQFEKQSPITAQLGEQDFGTKNFEIALIKIIAKLHSVSTATV